jgi:DNA polymerase elongation subunit (family B)
VWDDVKGYYTFSYQRYAYQKAVRGEYQSIYGDRLTKIYKFKKDDPELFESDVAETTRALVDIYTDSDDNSENIRVMTLDIEVEMETGIPDPKEGNNEMTAIGFHDNITNQYVVLVVDKEGKMEMKETEKALVVPFRTELEMAKEFLNMYERVIPDIITGWNIDYFDIPYLWNRLKNILGEHNANRLSPIGKSFYSPYRQRFFLGGVSCLDYLILYKKFNYTELPNYRLDTVGRKEIDMGKIEYQGSLDDLFNEDIDKFVEYNLVDVEIVVKLEEKLQFIDLCRGICHAGHVPYEDIVYSSKYLEGAMLTFLRRKGLVAPNKPADRKERMQEIRDNNEEKFIGAYVKDPIVGKYDWVYDLDLTSLYPSIIMTINISPETKIVKVGGYDQEKYVMGEEGTLYFGEQEITYEQLRNVIKEKDLSISSNGVLYTKEKMGCIPEILSLWFDKRVEFKDLAKKYGIEGNDALNKFYDKRQLVQKILLNSLYGVLGLPAFRFYDVDNAEAVTTTGQTVIKNTAKMGNIKYNKELNTPDADSNIYIDTDSVFFSAVPLLEHRYPDFKDKSDKEVAVLVDGVAGEMQDYLNDFYDILSDKFFNVQNHRLEIKKEYVARAGIWIAKKRYAQWIIMEKGVPRDRLDVKGLDVVRSSFPEAFRNLMSTVLTDILKGKEHDSISETVLNFRNSMVDLEPADMAKNSAVKNLSKYTKKTSKTLFDFMKGTPAHVKAALAYNDLLKHMDAAYKYAPMRNGDKIKWVYLRNNPLGLDAVGFTGYDDPPEINEFIDNYIDSAKIFERELLKKLQDFYDVLGWGDVVNERKNAEKFFNFD